MNEPPYPGDAVYQGVRGAFSEEAARRLLGARHHQARLIGLPTLEAVRHALQYGLARRAVVPVHNSIAGEVPGSDAIVRLAGTRIEAQVALPIVQCLVAPPGATLVNIRRVISHPMALAQCRRFLDARPWLRIQPHVDTAGALQMLMHQTTSGVVFRKMTPGVSEKRLPRSICGPAHGAAAIASERAAGVWGGTILQRGIQDTDDNCTTFVLVERLN